MMVIRKSPASALVAGTFSFLSLGIGGHAQHKAFVGHRVETAAWGSIWRVA